MDIYVFWVTSTDEWPNSSDTTGIFTPCSNSDVANVCLRQWGPTPSMSPISAPMQIRLYVLLSSSGGNIVSCFVYIILFVFSLSGYNSSMIASISIALSLSGIYLSELYLVSSDAIIVAIDKGEHETTDITYNLSLNELDVILENSDVEIYKGTLVTLESYMSLNPFDYDWELTSESISNNAKGFAEVLRNQLYGENGDLKRIDNSINNVQKIADVANSEAKK